jgi:DNA-binding beta-propeller fold protein YncE
MRLEPAIRTTVIVILACVSAVKAQQPLKLVQTISMPNVKGRIDHLGIDIKRGRLYIAGLGNNTMEVVDVRAGKWAESVPGFKTPQGIWYLPSVDKVFAASGDDGTCRVFRGGDLKLLDTIKLAPGVNRIAYNPVTHQLYAGFGGKDAGWNYGEIAIINPQTDHVKGTVMVAAHPAEILVDRSGRKLFVAIYPANKVQVIDIQGRTVGNTWSTGAAHPGDMALDETTGRLFIGSKNPPIFLVYDSASGKEIERMPIVEGQDGVYFDAKLKRIYISGGRELGNGFVDVIQEKDADHYGELARVPTGPGAGTSLFVPELNRLYVVVPSHAQTNAEVMVFEPHP